MATLLLFTILVFSSFCESSESIAAMSKAQLACTMCSSCDNPRQPIYSPPQPPPVSSHQPPNGIDYSSPPPPVLSFYYPPPYAGGSYFAPSTPIGYSSTSPPPNPIVSYFPFYYQTPPPPSAQQLQPDGLHSVKFKSQPSISSLSILFSVVLFL